MATPNRSRKGPPPPIMLPPAYQARPVPGPNAFAIAERAALVKLQEEVRQREAECRQEAERQQEVERQQEAERQQEVEHQQKVERQRSRSRPVTTEDDGEVQTSYHGGELSSVRRYTNSTSSRLSTKDAYSNLVEGVRKSPRMPEHSYGSSSTLSRDESTNRAKFSQRSYHNLLSTKRQLEGLGKETTSRATIEAQNERKYMKMVGQAPETPMTGNPNSYVTVNDLRQGRDKGTEHQELVSRSPKKKIFGVSIPFSSRSTMKSVPTPPMPPKAAKVMGATPPERTRKFSPLLARLPAVLAAPRSDTVKSLPAKLYNQPGIHGRHRSPPRRSSPLHSPVGEYGSRARRKSPPAQPAIFSHKETLAALEARTVDEMPPIPPRKDSLPGFALKYPERETALAPSTMDKLLSPPTPELELDDFEDTGMQLLLPLVPPLDPIPAGGGESPHKFCPVSNTAEMVQRPPIFSAYGTVEYSIAEEDEPGSYSAGLKWSDNGPAPAVRGEGRSAPATPTSAWLRGGMSAPKPRSAELEYLAPTVYAPPPEVRKQVEVGSGIGHSQHQKETPVRPAPQPRSDSPTPRPKRGSIPICFKGDVDEIEPLSATARDAASTSTQHDSFLPPKTFSDSQLRNRIMEELRLNLSANSAAAAQAPTPCALQPDQSSSRLTDMLLDVSPSKAEFHDFNGSSAVPSPLHRAPPQTQLGPASPEGVTMGPMLDHGAILPHEIMMAPPPRNSSLHDHFFMTNEHIDVVAMSLFDWVQSQNQKVVNAASSKHEQLKTSVEQQFESIKSQINSVGEKADDNGNQSHNLSVQLDNLRDFIKTEVVEPMGKQAQTMSAMEQGIKELQKAMQDVQKSASPNYAAGANYPSPSHQTGVLPNSRSQPSLPGYYDGNGSGHGPMPPVPSGAFGRYGANGQVGRSSYGRESRENHGFPNTGNPYHSPGGSFNNAYGTGGYQPPFNVYSPMSEQAQMQGYGGQGGQGVQKYPFGQP